MRQFWNSWFIGLKQFHKIKAFKSNGSHNSFIESLSHKIHRMPNNLVCNRYNSFRSMYCFIIPISNQSRMNIKYSLIYSLQFHVLLIKHIIDIWYILINPNSNIAYFYFKYTSFDGQITFSHQQREQTKLQRVFTVFTTLLK